jgi:hypothetical protein
MLDVHPPHQAAHTWKDFFIHIATICVGLLIAIGLEQSVELLHHRHERHLLTEEMQREARKNAEYLRIYLHDELQDSRWLHETAQIIKAAAPVDGKVTFTFPALPNQVPHATASRSVWSVARASGKVALLPEEQAEAYDRVDFDAELAMHATQSLRDAQANFVALLAQSNVPQKLTGTVTIPASQQSNLVAQMELMSALSNQAAQQEYFWLAASDAIADGARTQEDIWPYIRRESDLLKQ